MGQKYHKEWRHFHKPKKPSECLSESIDNALVRKAECLWDKNLLKIPRTIIKNHTKQVLENEEQEEAEEDVKWTRNKFLNSHFLSSPLLPLRRCSSILDSKQHEQRLR